MIATLERINCEKHNVHPLKKQPFVRRSIVTRRRLSELDRKLFESPRQLG
jgi:hypothetical protein